MLQNGQLRLIEVSDVRAVREGFERLEQLAVLAHLGRIGTQGRQTCLVGSPQFGAVTHGIEVADRAPGSAQPVVQLIHGQHQTFPCRVLALVLKNFFDAGAVVSEDLLDGRLHVLRTDRRERRQVVGLQ